MEIYFLFSQQTVKLCLVLNKMLSRVNNKNICNQQQDCTLRLKYTTNSSMYANGLYNGGIRNG